VLALVSAIAMIVVIVEKLRHPETPAGWASMLVIVLFMGGLQLLCLGVIGEYLGRAYLKLNHKPQFSVREQVGGTNLETAKSADLMGAEAQPHSPLPLAGEVAAQRGGGEGGV
jgi:hypothetical protein